MKRILIAGWALLAWHGCQSPAAGPDGRTPPQGIVHVVGAMKNVMWKGQLGGIIRPDTLPSKKGLYGLGPLEYLRGELLIVDGRLYVATIASDTAITVTETHEVKAPFFVYAYQTDWEVEPLPAEVRTVKELEAYLDRRTRHAPRPFVFKLEGRVDSAVIHVQNLRPGTKVTSPREAHQGQVNDTLRRRTVTVVGFFSTRHQGIFTHHDTYLHMHLITADRSKMGHLDKVSLSGGNVKLFLPKN